MAITDFQKIAAVKHLTGRQLKLGLLETVHDWKVEEDTILVTIARCQTDFKRGTELVVTKRGLTMWSAHLTLGGNWVWANPITAWFDDDEPEVYKTYVKTAEEKAAQQMWEEMCYRPGTPDHPLDNAARREQGY